jgi:pimeloyl-ACP methyl ester carboxylesterase
MEHIDEVVNEFLQGSVERRFKLMVNPQNAPALRAYFGDQTFDSHAALGASFLARRARTHLAGGTLRPQVVFVPGVMGSLLCSQGLGGTWWIDVPRLRKRLDDLRLAPNGEDDLDGKFRIEPCSVDHTYAEFLGKLAELEDFDYTVFPYDWRKPVVHAADRFRDWILREFEASSSQRVNVIAHSMGGLVVSAALMRYGDALWPKLKRIVFIGTPHYGSTAIAGYLKNHFWGFELLFLLGRFLSRPTFRSLTGVLNLLPAPAGVYPGTRQSDSPPRHPCADFDLYDADAWVLDLDAAERQQLAARLADTRRLHEQLHEWRRHLLFEQRATIAVIVGVGYKTLFRLESNAGSMFGVKRITSRRAGDPDRDGDGRVPLASAVLEQVAVRYIKGRHHELPMIPAVYNDAFRWLRGQEMTLPKKPESVSEPHLAPDDLKPHDLTLLPPRSTDSDPESPGYLQAEEPQSARLIDLEQQLISGGLPDFVRVRIL